MRDRHAPHAGHGVGCLVARRVGWYSSGLMTSPIPLGCRTPQVGLLALGHGRPPPKVEGMGYVMMRKGRDGNFTGHQQGRLLRSQRPPSSLNKSATRFTVTAGLRRKHLILNLKAKRPSHFGSWVAEPFATLLRLLRSQKGE